MMMMILLVVVNILMINFPLLLNCRPGTWGPGCGQRCKVVQFFLNFELYFLFFLIQYDNLFLPSVWHAAALVAVKQLANVSAKRTGMGRGATFVFMKIYEKN